VQTSTQPSPLGPNVIATIPDTGDDLPLGNVFEIVHTNSGTYADVEIDTDADIHVIPPRSPAITDFGFLSLEGITFAGASPKFFGLAVRDNTKQGATVRHGDAAQAASARARGCSRSPREPAREGRGRASGTPSGGPIAAPLEPARQGASSASRPLPGHPARSQPQHPVDTRSTRPANALLVLANRDVLVLK
jgi:hypothetical protein